MCLQEGAKTAGQQAGDAARQGADIAADKTEEAGAAAQDYSKTGVQKVSPQLLHLCWRLFITWRYAQVFSNKRRLHGVNGCNPPGTSICHAGRVAIRIKALAFGMQVQTNGRCASAVECIRCVS